MALGKRVCSPSEYESVDRMLTEARNAMENREDKVPCCYVFTDNGNSLIVLRSVKATVSVASEYMYMFPKTKSFDCRLNILRFIGYINFLTMKKIIQ